ncbi:MAG TPA: hypothetical protein VK615_07155, partial [Candidatus Binatia bacterium]|nr:hypothetical protein [Candidatus Binatia bacterium]
MKCSLALFCTTAFLSAASPETTRIIDRGPHHRTWEIVREWDAGGDRLRTTSTLVELEGGMNRLSE